MTRRKCDQLGAALMALGMALWLAPPAQAELYDPVSMPLSESLHAQNGDFLGTDGWNDMNILYSIILFPDGKTVYYSYTFTDMGTTKKISATSSSC